MEPEVSNDCAESLGIHVRVTRGGCDALMAQKGLDVAQVGSAFVEEECRSQLAPGAPLRTADPPESPALPSWRRSFSIVLTSSDVPGRSAPQLPL
jgi:hypothetical protein